MPSVEEINEQEASRFTTDLLAELSVEEVHGSRREDYPPAFLSTRREVLFTNRG